MAKEYVLNGARITSLEAFHNEISRVVIPGRKWGRNLDALDDILSGGFGTPPDGFTLRWSNSAASMESLGYQATARHLELKLQRCHPSNRGYVQSELASARSGAGPTLFDILVEIIRDHGPGGEQVEDNVLLVLD
jgi:RNAse (barnase) inhibitor barstar